MPRVKADGHADQADSERDPRAINDARQHIAAEPVGAEQKQLAALRRADQVEIARDEAPVIVLVAVAKEPDRLVLGWVRRVDPPEIGHVEMVAVAVDERPGGAAVIEHMQALRRRVDEVGMAAVERIGREHLAEHDDHVKSDQQRS